MTKPRGRNFSESSSRTAFPQVWKQREHDILRLRGDLAIYPNADSFYGLLGMSGLHSVSLRIQTYRNVKMRTTSSGG